MRFSDILGLARDNLNRARLRTVLTAAGVAIGTAAVVTLVSVGNVAFRIWLRGQGVTDQVGNLFVIPAVLIAGALVLATVVSLVAGAWPSRRAVRLQLLDALRYE